MAVDLALLVSGEQWLQAFPIAGVIAAAPAPAALLDLATDLPLAAGLCLAGMSVLLGAFKISAIEQ
jgi:hypothetical protein